jgi:predicted PurR-regulated permease PerM
VNTSPLAPGRSRVPIRTIAAAIGMVLATALALLLVYEVRRILVWIVVALFFTIALYPVVGWLERRARWVPRSLATLVIFLLVLVVIAGLLTAFVVPLAHEGATFVQQLPQLINDARAGRGPIGRLLERTGALNYMLQNQERLRGMATGLTTPAAGILRGIATGVAGVVTIFVLAFLMVLEGPKVVSGTLNIINDPRRRERVRRVSADCAKSITGYISGNLLISVICGLLTYGALKLPWVDVPYAALIALFVAIADLIPLIGATLGAVVALIAAGVHSLTAFIIIAVFFVLYQQLENHILQPLILARTVKLNPLTVLVSILIAVELAGILGAFLAIPAAGIIQVIIRDIWDHRHGKVKDEPTVGEDKVPADSAAAET